MQVSARWITNRNFDLLWYIGACLTSYALIYLNLGLGISALFLWWLWIVTVDGPHIFATFSRTYLDTEERHRRAGLLLGSLLWFLLGPVMLLAAVFSKNLLPFLVFLTFAQLWAYWHVVRQHYGFLVLYQKKNGEPAGKKNPVDYWIFYILMLAPFLSFLLRHPDARQYFGLGANLTQTDQAALWIIHGAILGAVLLYIGKETARVAKGHSFNVPKNLFLMACIPLHLFLFLHPYVSTHLALPLFAVYVTFYHNVQYHGIVWFYNRNRYGRGEDTAKFGLASLVSRNFLMYYAAGLLFTLIYRSANWSFIGGVDVAFSIDPDSLHTMTFAQLLTLGFWWGFAFHHYYLDQKIWKVSKDQQLNKDLQIGEMANKSEPSESAHEPVRLISTLS